MQKWHHRRCTTLTLQDLRRIAREDTRWTCASCATDPPSPASPPPPPSQRVPTPPHTPRHPRQSQPATQSETIGQISQNRRPTPGPLAYPCGNCGRSVGRDSVRCWSCDKWHHRRCTELSSQDLRSLSRSGAEWPCQRCSATRPPHRDPSSQLSCSPEPGRNRRSQERGLPEQPAPDTQSRPAILEAETGHWTAHSPQSPKETGTPRQRQEPAKTRPFQHHAAELQRASRAADGTTQENL